MSKCMFGAVSGATAVYQVQQNPMKWGGEYFGLVSMRARVSPWEKGRLCIFSQSAQVMLFFLSVLCSVCVWADCDSVWPECMVNSQLVNQTDSKRKRAWGGSLWKCWYKGQFILKDRAGFERVRVEQLILPGRIMEKLCSQAERVWKVHCVFGGCAFVCVETSGYPALALVDSQTHLLEQIWDRFKLMKFPTICQTNMHRQIGLD